MKIKVPVLPGDRVTAHNPLGKEVEGLVSGAFSVDITEEKTDVHYFVNGEEVNAKNCKLIKKEEKPVPFKELVIPDPIMPGTKTALLIGLENQIAIVEQVTFRYGREGTLPSFLYIFRTTAGTAISAEIGIFNVFNDTSMMKIF